MSKTSSAIRREIRLSVKKRERDRSKEEGFMLPVRFADRGAAGAAFQLGPDIGTVCRPAAEKQKSGSR